VASVANTLQDLDAGIEILISLKEMRVNQERRHKAFPGGGGNGKTKIEK